MKVYEEINIANKIRTYVMKAGANGIVIGLSGGIDSAVVYRLCKLIQNRKDFETVCPIYMPCGKPDLKPLMELTDNDFLTYDITEAYEVLTQNLLVEKQLTLANLKSRLRMCCLYAHANENNLLVIGTTNKSEMELGYFTKYGDGGVDFEPIAEYYKHEVYELAKILDIPESIITKPPSADLWEGQTDEKELGHTYKDIDDILTRIEKNQHKKEIPKVLRRD